MITYMPGASRKYKMKFSRFLILTAEDCAPYGRYIGPPCWRLNSLALQGKFSKLLRLYFDDRGSPSFR